MILKTALTILTVGYGIARSRAAVEHNFKFQIMSCSQSRSCHLFDEEKATDSLVGSIVVNTNEVGFYAFEANKTNLVKTHKVAIKNEANSREGWAEQDPVAILGAVQECVANVVVGGKVMGLKVIAVGIANHRGSVVAWNKVTGIPLSNVILRSDNRTVDMVTEYSQSHGIYRFQKICGLPFSPCFSAFKIKWLIDNDDLVKSAYRAKICFFGTVDSWLLWNLTGGVNGDLPTAGWPLSVRLKNERFLFETGGVFATDSSNAANTFLMNINTLEWDRQLLKFFNILPSCLSEIKTSSEIYGKIADGPLVGVPITGVIGNRQAALIGHRCFRRGLTKAILDESGSVFTITGENRVFSENGLLTTIGYQLDKRPVFALEGPIASVGKSIEWAKRCFRVKESECLTSDTKCKGQNLVYFAPAFAGLYAPHWKPEARATLVGVNECTVKDDILKAAMESVGFQTQDVVEAMKRDTNMSVDKIRVDGELCSNRFVMQSLSDITHARVEVARCREMTALGAAMAAGYAAEVNVWGALCMPEDRAAAVYDPRAAADDRSARMFDWRRALRRSYGWTAEPGRARGRGGSSRWTVASIGAGAVLLLAGYFVWRK